MSKKSPKEVLKSISEDLRERGITHAQAATALGYANVQSVSNLLSTARKNIKYLPNIQASRYAMTFGYSFDFLTTGEGELNPNSIHGYSFLEPELDPDRNILRDSGAGFHYGEQGLSDDEYKYRDLVNFVMNILTYSRNPYLIRLFEMYCDGKDMNTVDRCLSLIRQLREIPMLNYEQFRVKMADEKQPFDQKSYLSFIHKKQIIRDELEQLLGISKSKKMY